MNWQVQSIILISELAAGAVLFRFFIPFFRRVKTGKFDLYICVFSFVQSKFFFYQLFFPMIHLIGRASTIFMRIPCSVKFRSYSVTIFVPALSEV